MSFDDGDKDGFDALDAGAGVTTRLNTILGPSVHPRLTAACPDLTTMRMRRSSRPALAGLLLGTLAWALPAASADLAVPGSQRPYGTVIGGGGYRVARVSVRPVPMRYDIYGYPLLAGLPSPLAVGSGCPAAIQPDYDPDGNFAGYAPIPMCR